MLRLTCLVLSVTAVALLGAGQAAAQDHTAHARQHRHPGGALMIQHGLLTEPVCYFGRIGVVSGAPHPATCEAESTTPSLEPVLVGEDGVLYLLVPTSEAVRAQLRAWLGKVVEIRGTVYPAASAYLVVVRSVGEKPDPDSR